MLQQIKDCLVQSRYVSIDRDGEERLITSAQTMRAMKIDDPWIVISRLLPNRLRFELDTLSRLPNYQAIEQQIYALNPMDRDTIVLNATNPTEDVLNLFRTIDSGFQQYFENIKSQQHLITRTDSDCYFEPNIRIFRLYKPSCYITGMLTHDEMRDVLNQDAMTYTQIRIFGQENYDFGFFKVDVDPFWEGQLEGKVFGVHLPFHLRLLCHQCGAVRVWAKHDLEKWPHSYACPNFDPDTNRCRGFVSLHSTQAWRHGDWIL